MVFGLQVGTMDFFRCFSRSVFIFLNRMIGVVGLLIIPCKYCEGGRYASL